MDSSLPRTPSFNLAGKRALVAGASSGIGVGCAVALCEAGAAVTLVARSKDTLEELQKQMISEGWDATARPLDVTDVNATKQMIENELPFDILVNSAGMARHSASLDTTISNINSGTKVITISANTTAGISTSTQLTVTHAKDTNPDRVI